jgi:hypothetical protein
MVCAALCLQKPGVMEFVQQRHLATSDDVFYVSTGRWYTHNCSDFETPMFNASMWALAQHYQVCVCVRNPAVRMPARQRCHMPAVSPGQCGM